jgi:hypothetical protein
MSWQGLIGEIAQTTYFCLHALVLNECTSSVLSSNLKEPAVLLDISSMHILEFNGLAQSPIIFTFSSLINFAR